MPDDFPVALHAAPEQGLVFCLSRHGLLFVNDLATAAPLHVCVMSSAPVLLAAPSPAHGGLYAVNWCAPVGLAEEGLQWGCGASGGRLALLQLGVRVEVRGPGSPQGTRSMAACAE